LRNIAKNKLTPRKKEIKRKSSPNPNSSKKKVDNKNESKLK
jgi:hypothetical protein